MNVGLFFSWNCTRASSTSVRTVIGRFCYNSPCLETVISRRFVKSLHSQGQHGCCCYERIKPITTLESHCGHNTQEGKEEALLTTLSWLHEGCVLNHWSPTRGPLGSSGSPFNFMWSSIWTCTSYKNLPGTDSNKIFSWRINFFSFRAIKTQRGLLSSNAKVQQTPTLK
jgi:hypothetical protein